MLKVLSRSDWSFYFILICLLNQKKNVAQSNAKYDNKDNVILIMCVFECASFSATATSEVNDKKTNNWSQFSASKRTQKWGYRKNQREKIKEIQRMKTRFWTNVDICVLFWVLCELKCNWNCSCEFQKKNICVMQKCMRLCVKKKRPNRKKNDNEQSISQHFEVTREKWSKKKRKLKRYDRK